MDNLWWSSVPNARRFVDDITARINNEESLMYNINDFFPWYDTFYSIIFDNSTTADKTMKVINTDDIGDVTPGKYILEKNFKPELRDKYRSSIGFEKFIAENDSSSVLKNSIILIRCNDELSVVKWHDFVTGYIKHHNPSTPMGCFIIENNSEKTIMSGLPSFSPEDYFHKYDIDMFSLLITSSIKSESKENIIIKRYSAELASLLAGNDIELAASLASKGKNLAYHSDFVIKEILDKETRSNYCDFSINGDINQIIREAQIKIFYPEIENFRNHFINKYADDFPPAITLKNCFGDSVDDISCLELGNLKFLCDSGRLNTNYADYSNLKFYRECRNKLAHTTVLSSDEMERLSKCQY